MCLLSWEAPPQGVRERARVPQLVMLCRWWAYLQCFAGRIGRTHGTTAGYCVAGKRAQYCNIRPLKKFKVSNTCALSLPPCVSVPQCLQWNPKLNICRPFWPCSLTPCIIDYVKTAEKYSKNPNHHQCTSAHSPFCRGESAKFLHGFKSVLRFDVLLQGIFINVHIAIMV